MLLKILQCPAQPTQQSIILLKIAGVLGLRNPALQEPRGGKKKKKNPEEWMLRFLSPRKFFWMKPAQSDIQDLGLLKQTRFFEGERCRRAVRTACFNMNSLTCNTCYFIQILQIYF